MFRSTHSKWFLGGARNDLEEWGKEYASTRYDDSCNRADRRRVRIQYRMGRFRQSSV